LPGQAGMNTLMGTVLSGSQPAMIEEMIMRTWKLGLIALVLMAASPDALAGGLVTRNQAKSPKLTEHPWSVGTQIGVMTVHTSPMFNLEIPVEFTLPAGPGDLAIHAGFMLSAGGRTTIINRAGVRTRGDVWVGLPIGARYKIRVLASHPLYVWPLVDFGPLFDTWSGEAAGFFRTGAGISYIVHPNVELLVQPLNIGATFDGNGGWFLFNFTLGANFRF